MQSLQTITDDEPIYVRSFKDRVSPPFGILACRLTIKTRIVSKPSERGPKSQPILESFVCPPPHTRLLKGPKLAIKATLTNRLISIYFLTHKHEPSRQTAHFLFPDL